MCRLIGVAALAVLVWGCRGGTAARQDASGVAPGSPVTAKTAALDSGANILQSKGPISAISYYLDGFHPSKGDPAAQMEAHHYCTQLTEDFAQCVLYDGNSDTARLIGIEYIISEQTYTTLPEEEKALWHPHNFEILSGQLRMPGVPDVAEKAALRRKINSYGKTWHTWMAGMSDGRNDRLPLGPPRLQWSFNRDGEIMPGLVTARDRRLGLSTADARADRQEFTTIARPQGGVDAMAGQFPSGGRLIPGVRDNGDQGTRPVPTFGLTAPASAPVDH